MVITGTVKLQKGREKSLLRRHPWVFSGAIESLKGDPKPGETVDVFDSKGNWLARGAYSPLSKIRVRIWTWNQDEEVDENFLEERIRVAIGMRKALKISDESTAMRLIHGESDWLPGFIVDQYNDVLVMQVLSAGAEAWREVVADSLMRETGAKGIFERSDVDVRTLEGLEPRTGILRGEVPEKIIIEENQLQFLVNLKNGQKTGFYVDQRRNRQMLREMMPEAADVLNCFCYTGAFSVYALAGGASSVISIDSSKDALRIAEENLRLNGFGEADAEWMEADVFHQLRKFRDSRHTFDVIILDPPKFAPTSALAQRAARGYKDINLLALKLLRPGGLLFTYSCSGGISADLFQKIVAGAALDAGVHAKIINKMVQGEDHPISLDFPEGMYLKGLLCRVD
ncbi:MAG: class I SAM-dependent rRNA methyltransferase [Anaerolineaceae bacterium]|nr:class I SAM-dependent rRNA methyltransferase [Anaerolineaceae bacterium]